MKKNMRFVFRAGIIVSAILGYIGWFAYDGNPVSASSIWMETYKTVTLFIFNGFFDRVPIPWPLAVASYLAPLSIAGTIVLVALRSGRNWSAWLGLRLFAKEHVIIAGLSDASLFMLRGKPSKKHVVLIVPGKAPDPDSLAAIKNLHVVYGELDESVTWRIADVHEAESVFVFADEGTSIGGMKRAIEKSFRRRRAGRERMTATFVLPDLDRHRIFAQKADLLATRRKGLEFTTMGLPLAAASGFAVDFAPHLGLRPSDLDEHAPHVVIEGANDFIIPLLIEFGELYHYHCIRKTKVTLVSDDPGKSEGEISRIPGLLDVLDLGFVSSATMNRQLANPDASFWETTPVRVVIFPDNLWALPERARQWRRHFVMLGHGKGFPALDAIVPISESTKDFGEIIGKEFAELGIGIHSVEDSASWSNLVSHRELFDRIARQIHETYRTKYTALKPWNKLSESERDSNRRPARHLRIKLWYLGFRLEEGKGGMDLPIIDEDHKHMLAEMEHRRWMADKLLDGYIAGMPSASEDASYFKSILRVHGDIRAFDQLDMVGREKDNITFEDLKGLLKNLEKEWRLVPMEGGR